MSAEPRPDPVPPVSSLPVSGSGAGGVTVEIPGLAEAAVKIIEAAGRIDGRGWCPATSSNFSCRLGAAHCALTVSGRHKGRLTPADILAVDLEGRSLDGRRPSAETLLHTSLYRDEHIGAVLHTHSLHATLVSMRAGAALVLEGLELLKAFRGIETHDCRVEIPVYDNDQDIAALAGRIESHWRADRPAVPAYLIRGHGLYVWGESMDDAMRHLEAMEFLLEYTWHSMDRGHSDTERGNRA